MDVFIVDVNYPHFFLQAIKNKIDELWNKEDGFNAKPLYVCVKLMRNDIWRIEPRYNFATAFERMKDHLETIDLRVSKYTEQNDEFVLTLEFII